MRGSYQDRAAKHPGPHAAGEGGHTAGTQHGERAAGQQRTAAPLCVCGCSESAKGCVCPQPFLHSPTQGSLNARYVLGKQQGTARPGMR